MSRRRESSWPSCVARKHEIKRKRPIAAGTRMTDNWLTCGCSIDDINKHCLKEFRNHWKCLDHNNQQLWHCRAAERPLNKCIFDNLVRNLPVLATPPTIECLGACHSKTAKLSNGYNGNVFGRIYANAIHRNWRRSSQIHQRARSQCIFAHARSTPRTRYLVTGKVEEVDVYEQGLQGRLYIGWLGE